MNKAENCVSDMLEGILAAVGAFILGGAAAWLSKAALERYALLHIISLLTICRIITDELKRLSEQYPVVTATADPRAFIAQCPDGGVLDEIQRVPALLSEIQVDVDEKGKNVRFILTGSRNFEMTATYSGDRLHFRLRN